MKKEIVYLDTSVLSAYYDKRTKERQEITVKFWNHTLPTYQVCISEITIEELENTRDEILRRKFRQLIEGFKVFKSNERIRDLARIYITRGIFPERYFDDAHHVAIASFYKVAFVVSWNFEHLVKVKTRRLVNSINLLEGFKEIEIVSPQEL